MNSEAKAVLHGHSKISDGISSVEEIVMAAIKSRINLLAISDHGDIRQNPLLYNAVSSLRNQGANIEAVSATELSTSQGDILFAKTGPLDKDFTEWARRVGKNPWNLKIVDLINEGVKYHNALAIIVHPVAPFMNAVSISGLYNIRNRLPDDVFKNVGIEKDNYSYHSLLVLSQLRALAVGILNRKLKFAEMGYPDYHTASLVGSQYTTFDSEGKNFGDDFMKAVRNRETSSVQGMSILKTYPRILSTMIEVKLAERKKLQR